MLILGEGCFLDSHHVQGEIEADILVKFQLRWWQPPYLIAPLNQICHCSVINLWAVIYYCAVIWAPISKLWLPSTAVNAGRQSKAEDEICGEPGSLKSRMTSPVAKASSARSSQVQPHHFQLLKGCEEEQEHIKKWRTARRHYLSICCLNFKIKKS